MKKLISWFFRLFPALKKEEDELYGDSPLWPGLKALKKPGIKYLHQHAKFVKRNAQQHPVEPHQPCFLRDVGYCDDPFPYAGTGDRPTIQDGPNIAGEYDGGVSRGDDCTPSSDSSDFGGYSGGDGGGGGASSDF